MKWMAQKDLLGQDVFLIGPPGPLRRVLAMQYLELTRKEVEYISLSRDTTESDLKQRREMRKGTSFYIDQCAVRAAVEGRVLIIEGVEKAERNVLPALNNLLENREMQLDDGRFLMHHKRYDQLLQDHSKETLDKWQLVRVSEDFRVFALGLPVPKYRGHPLDPPLRSRFQARDVYHLGFSVSINCWTIVIDYYGDSDKHEYLSSQLTCMLARATIQQKMFFNIIYVNNLSFQFPGYPIQNLLSRLYPYKLVLNKEGTQAVEDIYQKFELSSSSANSESLALHNINVKNNHKANVSLHNNNENHNFEVRYHTYGPRSSKDEFVATSYHQRLLADLMLSHGAMDMCIIGGKGCGKSSVLREFARLLSYRTEPVLMYQDMTARDLLQQRYTLPNGDTVWKISPLIEAALEGGMAVLDGLNRVNPGTLSILQRLVHDREVTLHDGTRLLRHDKFDGMKEKLNLNDQELNEKAVYRIHPSFRMIGLAEPPTTGSSAQQWLNPELLTLFLYHHMEPLSVNNELEVIQKLVNVSMDEIKGLLKLCQKLRSAKDIQFSLAGSLSTRQLIRISKRLAASQHNTDRLKLVSDAVHKACLSRFLPQLARSALCGALESSGLPPEAFPVQDLTMNDISCEVKDGFLTIGGVSAPLCGGEEQEESSVAKVPDVLFYNNAQHLAVMKDMLQDYNLGEHILIVGNQGVGKNKIVDRFLHLLNKPREYLQLHRDTTVQSLTVQPTVRDGIIVYEDSALVRAARMGHALVVDEADKAPTHVTCILKALLESGRATLADGRKILDHLSTSTSNKEVILMHPDFRMFVLANRPGFPFLGNDFFGAVGDVFSCHAVDNPSVASELDMLRQYGANVPESSLKKLVAAFGELRDLADRGLISYPYSTREVVNIVKHLEKFPKEGLANVVRNVFDFDAYSKETKEQLSSVMHKHGIPIGAKPHDVRLAKPLRCSVKFSLITTERESGEDVTAPKHGKIDPKNAPHVGGNTWAGGTGGRDTAGMGGKGGPYRLDMGHDVTQIPDWEKEAVPEHVKKAAREVAQKAFKERLREIRMSEFDADMYEKFSSHVRKQVKEKLLFSYRMGHCRFAKGKERQWLKHQATGELDDMKLIEGLTGEKNIYKRRAEQEPEPGTPQQKPKRIRVVMDVSGSMYRFNGLDNRLERTVEAACLVMESFEGYKEKFKYELWGHSGDGFDIPLVTYEKPPTNNKERLEVMKTMHAHAQFCMSGDHTLEAAEYAVKNIKEQEADEYFVVVLSDANLERYGIRPMQFAEVLTSDDEVNAFVIFIGSLGDQAERLKKQLPLGRSFVCMDTKNIPQILQQIFTSSLL
uniref:von Willebrand factor A domain-containing protein 8 n=1 Tax=Ciona savignyi TaxID=51511 RepID=H2YJD6_CIOSA